MAVTELNEVIHNQIYNYIENLLQIIKLKIKIGLFLLVMLLKSME